MARRTVQSLSKLPQSSDQWLIGIAQLRIWITPPDETPHRPWLIIVLSREKGIIRASNLVPNEPTPAQVRDVLFQAMRNPPREIAKPARPQAIAIARPFDVSGLLSLIRAEDLELDVYEIELPPQFTEMIADLEEQLRGGPEHPGYLSVKGVTPELVGGLFAAAAEFYHAAPWVKLNNSQVLALRHPAESDYRYAIVMGNGGVEYGVMMLLRWEDVRRQFLGDDDPMEQIPKGGLQSIFYDTIDKVPVADLEAMEKYGWTVAAPDAYPIAWIVDRKGRPRRPSRQDLEWYEAALRAIPIIVRDELKPNAQGHTRRLSATAEYAPIETTVEVATHRGTISVAVKYPAGEIPLAELSVLDPDWGEEEGEADEFPHFDRRAMEGAMFRLTGPLGDRAERADSELDAAQATMYRAWEETNPAKRIALAHDALVQSADCADAYVLLAEEEADTVSRAFEYYQAGVAAGERALGKKFFQEYAGHFWGLLETRPYMRAREGVAKMLWRLNRQEEALAEYQEMLRLNPNDNQGVRYLALDLLMGMERYDQAQELLAEYRDEWSSVWMYTRALLAFRRFGHKVTASRALAKALEQNPHVPPYLTGHKRIPNRRPDYMGMGDEREAIWYASEHLNHWRRIPGAIEWLIMASKQKSKPGKVGKGKRNKANRD